MEHQDIQISGPVIDVLAPWPAAQDALRTALAAPGRSRSLARLTRAERRDIDARPLDEQRDLLAAKAQSRDPLGVLACVPFGVPPFDDPAMAGLARPAPLTRLAPSGVTLIAKLTRYCNLRCSYCKDWRDGPGQNMTVAVQRQMLAAALSSGHFGACKIVWHGGEPSQFGVRRSLQFLWLQGRMRRPGQHLQNSLQTNGAFLTDDVVGLWRAFGIGASVSLDGLKDTHDRTRKRINGTGSFDHVIAGIDRLKRAGLFQGALMVVTPELAAMDPHRIVTDLVAHGIHQAAFLPVRPSAKDATGPYLDPGRFAQFLIRLFDTLRRAPDLDFNLRELDALFNAYRKQPTGFCELNGPCLGHYFAVDPDGTIMHCDKFLNADGFVLGNVRGTRLCDLSQSAQIKDLQARDTAARRALQTCAWYNNCKGWCPHEAHIAALRGDDRTCCGMAPVFDHFAQLEERAHA